MLIDSLLSRNSYGRALFSLKLELILLIGELKRLGQNKDNLPDYYKSVLQDVWNRIEATCRKFPADIVNIENSQAAERLFWDDALSGPFHVKALQCLLMLDPVFDIILNKDALQEANQNGRDVMMIALKKSQMFKVLKVMAYDELLDESDDPIVAQIQNITSEDSDPAGMYEHLGQIIMDDPGHNMYHSVRYTAEYLHLSKAQTLKLSKHNILFHPVQVESLSRMTHSNVTCNLQKYNIINNYYAFVYIAVMLNRLIAVHDNNAERIDAFLSQENDPRYKLIVDNWSRGVFDDPIRNPNRNKQSFAEFMAERTGRGAADPRIIQHVIGRENDENAGIPEPRGAEAPVMDDPWIYEENNPEYDALGYDEENEEVEAEEDLEVQRANDAMFRDIGGTFRRVIGWDVPQGRPTNPDMFTVADLRAAAERNRRETTIGDPTATLPDITVRGRHLTPVDITAQADNAERLQREVVTAARETLEVEVNELLERARGRYSEREFRYHMAEPPLRVEYDQNEHIMTAHVPFYRGLDRTRRF